MSSLADRLRGIITPNRSDLVGRAAPAVEASDGDLESLLEGRWYGHCFIVERRLAASAKYGRETIGDLADRLHASAADAPLVCRSAGAGAPFVFFDLETTGLSGGAGTQAFLVGCAWFNDDRSLTTRQYVLVRYSDERAMLTAVADDLGRAGALVSFNGKSFDAPLLESRFQFHRLDWTPSGRPHLDVLHHARRFWKEDDCSLVVLEQQVLGAWRDGDVSGYEIPARYFQFVRSGDARPLVAILEHNRLDLISLAGLTSRLLEIVRGGPDYVENAREALALGAVYTRAHAHGRALAAFERAVTLAATSRSRQAAFLTIDALRALAVAYRRARRFDDAARCWTALIESECPSAIEREAIEALAIHHEHRRRDLESARLFAERNLDASRRQHRDALKISARQRLERIERKLSAVESQPLLP